MALRIGINGFGRIGRNVLRAGWSNPAFEFVHINDLTSGEMLAYLLHRDTVHGTWGDSIRAVDGGIEIDGRKLSFSAERDPRNIGWGDKGVDIVLECTGVFTSGPKARAHIDGGAKRVIISAPGKDIDGTFVVGVNDDSFDPDKHFIISNASCTTNCLAPAVKVLDDLVGIKAGQVTTVHAYTMDQNLLDAPHSGGKFRRSRAAAQNMVPTSTGAAEAIGLVMPHLSGRLTGMAVRVPTPNVSLVDLVFNAGRATTVEEINTAFEAAAASGPLAGVLATTREPVVSSDLIGNPASSTVDLPLTKVVDGSLVKVITWYDNEWGFSNRMLDLARVAGGQGR